MKKNNLIVLLAFASGGGVIYHITETAKLRATINSLRSQIENLRVKLALANEDLSNCRNDAIGLEEAAKSAKAAAKASQTKSDKLEARLEQVEEEKEALDRRINKLEATIIRLKEKIADKQAKLNRLLSSKTTKKEEADSIADSPVIHSSTIETTPSATDPEKDSIADEEAQTRIEQLSKQEKIFVFFVILIIVAVGTLSSIAGKGRRRRYY